MALLNDLKKILFGAKAVTKSAAGKAYEAGKEAGQELAENSAELIGKAKDKAGDLAEDIGSTILKASETLKSKAEDMMGGKEEGQPSQPAAADDDIMDEIIASAQTAQSATPEETLELTPLKNTPEPPQQLESPSDEDEDVFDMLKKNTASGDVTTASPNDPIIGSGRLEGKTETEKSATADEEHPLGTTTEKPGGTIMDATEQVLGKAADFTESLGKKVMDKSSDLADKFGETAEDVGEAIFEKGGEAIERAKDMASDLGSKILKAKEELMAKAEAEAAKTGETTESLMDKMKNLNQKLEDKISGNNQQFADKPLDTGGSEFSKHGSFWEKADRFAKGDYHMKGKEPKPGELTIKENPDYKAPDKGKVKGFDDGDGDGDELIDDAIVEG